ncbi:MAG: restriction endonuclease [Verrucomicrobiota bacterium]
MPIPDFQTLMRPLLNLANDGKEHRFQDSVNQLASDFSLTKEDLQIPLPSGSQPIFTNRVAWAKTHLKMAGLLASNRRGYFHITDLGKKILTENPDRIDLKVLRSLPGYLDARDGKKTDETKSLPLEADESRTPEEQMESAFLSIRQTLGREILEKLLTASPSFFEKTVVELVVAMGYGGTRKDAGQAIGQTGDEGIDGIIKEDRLGLDIIYLQAKRWTQTVGRPEIQKFAGALQGFRAKKGIFITTSDFSREAIEYASRIDSKIVLIDSEQLWNLMIDFEIGVSKTATYEIKKIDHDYFEEEND